VKRALIVGGATAALAFSSAGIALAGSTPDTAPERGVRGLSDPVTTACNGGTLKQVKSVSTDNGYNYYEGAPTTVKGARIRVSGPARGKDTVIVTFSASSALGNSTDGDYDQAVLQARVDGSHLRPGRDEEAVLTGASNQYESSSLQFCGRIGGGTHTLDLTTQVLDNATDDGLYLFLDDWTMKVEVYN